MHKVCAANDIDSLLFISFRTVSLQVWHRSHVYSNTTYRLLVPEFQNLGLLIKSCIHEFYENYHSQTIPCTRVFCYCYMTKYSHVKHSIVCDFFKWKVHAIPGETSTHWARDPNFGREAYAAWQLHFSLGELYFKSLACAGFFAFRCPAQMTRALALLWNTISTAGTDVIVVTIISLELPTIAGPSQS